MGISKCAHCELQRAIAAQILTTLSYSRGRMAVDAKPVDGSDDAAAATPSVEALFPSLYHELRRLARSRLTDGVRPTLLDTSALVHEAYMRMQRDGGVEVTNRDHFLAYAATTMRSIVVDFVRRRSG